MNRQDAFALASRREERQECQELVEYEYILLVLKPNAQCPMPNAPCPMPNAQCP
ncbi:MULTISPECIES: hypothetical protein [Calothrix]|uniref:Uncharacterized protein n=2 Tax=Calothrix TaxID=1186 RepID=A0ABR8AAV4_9CYAN|nr:MULTISPECIES: hypothetical protein [Calothrix]MBD2196560.1 hypothetical protein [Calothrix parietina FACHB-288]MBD2227400.1 hypothetical protein [Calothrix anomala FACHB-343]